MCDLVKACGGLSRVLVLLSLLLTMFSASVQSAGLVYGLGQKLTPEQIDGWDIDIRPDGQGLPEGSGDAIAGDEIYIEKCASCHGEFGEGMGRYPVLAGGDDSLGEEDPVKTVGSYWPYASTVFDYVRRAMPFGHAQSLSADETYSITAFILAANEIIDDDFVVDQDNLAEVQMPNHDGFIADSRDDEGHRVSTEPCMNECLPATPVVVGKARQIDVTPESDQQQSTETQVASIDGVNQEQLDRGKKVFQQCAGCHALEAERHGVGPSLVGLFGRGAGQNEGFSNYSEAMTSAKLVWDEASLGQFVSDPDSLIPGTSMPFAGITDSESVADLILYLKIQLSAE